MSDSIKKRRELVSEYLTKNKTETEIAQICKVSRQTIVRDVSAIKGQSQTWLDGLAKNGFVFEFKKALDKIRETGIRLELLFSEAKDIWQKLAILKAIEQNAKLYLELLGETPTIHAYRKATKVLANVS